MLQRAKALEPDDVRRLRALVARHRHSQRDNVIVLLSFKAGLRACEVAPLRWSMVLNSAHQISTPLCIGGGISKGVDRRPRRYPARSARRGWHETAIADRLGGSARRRSRPPLPLSAPFLIMLARAGRVSLWTPIHSLLAQIPEDERIFSVGGDGAYDARACHAAIAARGADAVIPVRRNGRPSTKDGLGVDARNEALRATKRLGRTIWKTRSDDHRRSLVETKMHCFKLLGQRVVARAFHRQITELKVRTAILNRYSEIGTAVTVRIV